MSAVTVKQLVTDFEHGMGDATRIDQEYNEVVEALEKLNWWHQTTLVTMTKSTGQYSFPTDAIRLVTLFYDDRQLIEEPKLAVESESPTWQDQQGTPISYVLEDEPDRKFRLYPKPLLNSKDFIFALGAPFGQDFPEYAVAAVATKRRATFSVWFDMLAALLICAREFKREGRQRDPDFAVACDEVARLVIEYLS